MTVKKPIDDDGAQNEEPYPHDDPDPKPIGKDEDETDVNSGLNG